MSVWQEDLGQIPGPGYEDRSATVASLFLDTATEAAYQSWTRGRRPGCKWPVWSGRLLITQIVKMPSKGPTQSPALKQTEGKKLQEKKQGSAGT